MLVSSFAKPAHRSAPVGVEYVVPLMTEPPKVPLNTIPVSSPPSSPPSSSWSRPHRVLHPQRACSAQPLPLLFPVPWPRSSGTSSRLVLRQWVLRFQGQRFSNLRMMFPWSIHHRFLPTAHRSSAPQQDKPGHPHRSRLHSRRFHRSCYPRHRRRFRLFPLLQCKHPPHKPVVQETPSSQLSPSATGVNVHSPVTFTNILSMGCQSCSWVRNLPRSRRVPLHMRRSPCRGQQVQDSPYPLRGYTRLLHQCKHHRSRCPLKYSCRHRHNLRPLLRRRILPQRKNLWCRGCCHRSLSLPPGILTPAVGSAASVDVSQTVPSKAA